MKHLIYRIILLLVSIIACVPTVCAVGKVIPPSETTPYKKVEIDGIWYELDSKNRTAMVTYPGDSINIRWSEQQNQQQEAAEEALGDSVKRYSGDVVLPSVVRYKRKKYSVTGIGEGAFMFCDSLTSVRIPLTVTSIGEGAFAACTKLHEIVVEEGNKTYDSRNSCNAIIETASNTLLTGCMTTIIPESVSSIAAHAFFGCVGMNSIVIPNGVTHIGKDAFFFCRNLRSVVLPASLTDIGEDAFDGCENLNRVHISDLAAWCQTVFHTITSNPLTYAGNLYLNNTKMTELEIPDDVERICSYAFYGCRSLFSIIIHSNVQVIGQEAFHSVRNIFYAGSASGIPWGARFANSIVKGALYYSDTTKTRLIACSPSVEGTFVIPASVTHIEDSAFADCHRLTSLTIPESVTWMGRCVFDSCTALTSVKWNARNCTLEQNEGGTITPPFRNLNVEKFTFGENVECIPASLCSWLKNLTSVTIPKDIQQIGDEAFRGCSGLTEPIYNSHIFACLPPTYSGEYTIPDGIKTIAGGAFSDCKDLTAIIIPASIETIGTYAFQNCTALTSVIIPEGVKSLAFGLNFMNCSSLTSVHWNARSCKLDMHHDGIYYAPFAGDTAISSFTFNEQIETIPAALCSGLSNLTSLFIPNNTKSIGAYAFNGCIRLSSLKFPAKTTQVGDFAFLDCKALTEPLYNGFVFAFLPTAYSGAYEIPDNGMTTIAGGAFYKCTELTAVTIPACIKQIGFDAFFGCTGLTEVSIPEGVETIGIGGTFQRCTSLTTVYWNAVRCVLDEYTNGSWYPPFYELENITNMVFGENVQSIPNGLCCRMRGLTSITLPPNLTHIGSYAFQYCSGLTSVTIPDHVTTIGRGAFSDCTGFIDVTIPESVISIGLGATFQRCTALTTVRWNAVNCSIEPFEENHYYPPFFGLNSITSFTLGGQVEYIPACLCYGLNGLTSVTIPSKVKSIGQQAFAECKSLTTIRVKAAVPPETASDAFDHIAPDAIVYVPEKSYKTYKNADVWKRMNLKQKKKKKK